MQTVTINVYNVNELNESALEKAHQDYLCNGFDYHWLDESLTSVRNFCALFDAEINDYSLGTCSYSYIKTDVNNSCFRGLKLRRAKSLKVVDDYYLDHVLVTEFKDRFKQTGDAKQAFNMAIDLVVKVIVQDMEHQESLEYFCEMADCNSWQFFENGEYYG